MKVSKIYGRISYDCQGIVNYNGPITYGPQKGRVAAKFYSKEDDSEESTKSKNYTLYCSYAKIKREIFSGMTGLKSKEMKDLKDKYCQSEAGILNGYMLDGSRRRAALILSNAIECVIDKSALMWSEFHTGPNPTEDAKDKQRDMPFKKDTAGDWKAEQKFTVDLENLVMIEGNKFTELENTLSNLNAPLDFKVGSFITKSVPADWVQTVELESVIRKGALLTTKQAVALITSGLTRVTKFELIRNTGTMKFSNMTICVEYEDKNCVEFSDPSAFEAAMQNQELLDFYQILQNKKQD